MKKLIAILLCMPCMASAEFMSGNNLHAKMTGDFGEKMQALGFIQTFFVSIYPRTTRQKPDTSLVFCYD